MTLTYLPVQMAPRYSFQRVANPQLFYDSFTGVDGTLLTAHAPDRDVVGGGWVAGASNFVLASNRAVANVGSGAQVYANVNNANVRISALLTVPSFSVEIGILCRYTGLTAHYYCNLNTSTGTARISEVNVGTIIRAQRAGLGGVGYTNVPAIVECSGSTIRFYSTSVIVFDISYALATFNQTATRHGVRGTAMGSTYRVDNFDITRI